MFIAIILIGVNIPLNLVRKRPTNDKNFENGFKRILKSEIKIFGSKCFKISFSFAYLKNTKKICKIRSNSKNISGTC